MSAPVRQAGGMQAEAAEWAGAPLLVDRGRELEGWSIPVRRIASLGFSTRAGLIGVVLALCGSRTRDGAVGIGVDIAQLNGSVWTIFERQALWMGIGLIAFVATMRFDYRHWRRPGCCSVYSRYGLCVLVLIPGIGVDAGGSSRWIGIGQLRLQPSELMKLAVVCSERICSPGAPRFSADRARSWCHCSAGSGCRACCSSPSPTWAPRSSSHASHSAFSSLPAFRSGRSRRPSEASW